MKEKPIGTSLFFTANSNDGLGPARKKVFTYILNQYIDTDIFHIDSEGNDVNIIKK